MKMNNKTYDILKWVALVLLPAFIALYSTVGEIWGIPYVIQVVSTLAAINTFLGAILGVSSTKYKKAEVNTDKQ